MASTAIPCTKGQWTKIGDSIRFAIFDIESIDPTRFFRPGLLPRVYYQVLAAGAAEPAIITEGVTGDAILVKAAQLVLSNPEANIDVQIFPLDEDLVIVRT